jgi:hypothetical protein
MIFLTFHSLQPELYYRPCIILLRQIKSTIPVAATIVPLHRDY